MRLKTAIFIAIISLIQPTFGFEDASLEVLVKALWILNENVELTKDGKSVKKAKNRKKVDKLLSSLKGRNIKITGNCPMFKSEGTSIFPLYLTCLYHESTEYSPNPVVFPIRFEIDKKTKNSVREAFEDFKSCELVAGEISISQFRYDDTFGQAELRLKVILRNVTRPSKVGEDASKIRMLWGDGEQPVGCGIPKELLIQKPETSNTDKQTQDQ